MHVLVSEQGGGRACPRRQQTGAKRRSRWPLARGCSSRHRHKQIPASATPIYTHHFHQFCHLQTLFLALICSLIFPHFHHQLPRSEAASINYGISQKPITDINQLMPVLCQSQSVICEGSFCIPGVKRCVCDLRQPVVFGKFCLRQIDIETKCFASSQCNHTIKDAVCLDTSTQAVLDYESSRYKLEQWHNLNELRMAQSKDSPTKQQTTITTTVTASTLASTTLGPMFLTNEKSASSYDELVLEARNDVIMTNLRNSPYELTTPELLQQNHTRRRQNADPSSLDGDSRPRFLQPSNYQTTTTDSSGLPFSAVSTLSTYEASTSEMVDKSFTTIDAILNGLSSTLSTANNQVISEQAQASNNLLDQQNQKKKLVVKSLNWPPGVCSCPPGFMFDSMLRKCLGLSLADAHCQSDKDCKQIRLTHCSERMRRCECDEPFIWNQTEMICQRPIKGVNYQTSTSTSSDDSSSSMTIMTDQTHVTRDSSSNPTGTKDGFVENLLAPLIATKLIPSPTILLLIFVIVVIVATVILLIITVKCFSSSNSTLISPKSSKCKHSKNSSANGLSRMPPRSPYATLKRPEYHNKHSQFAQATRGRILNYDFEQDSPTQASGSAMTSSATMHRGASSKSDYKTTTTIERQLGGGTLSRLKLQNKNVGGASSELGDGSNMLAKKASGNKERPVSRAHSKCSDDMNHSSKVNHHGQTAKELGDNVSIGQLELDVNSEASKSESESLMQIPAAPPANQPPPYMLASSSALKVQGSAIAAAAAAVANRRIQMAQKQNGASDQTQQPTSSARPTTGNVGTPVFL